MKRSKKQNNSISKFKINHKNNIIRKMKRTGSTNPMLKDLIMELKKRSNDQSVSLWKRIALDLEKPTRQRRIVNLSGINRHTKENETIIVPGKVLGSGILNHKLIISAYQFSEQALDKLEKSGAKIVPLLELSKEKPDGKKIRIIG
ncbi:MAG TPA: 50S ribosomal protein L18e [Candidatus Woesearchaeota archaeon]|jgi:large subunit ribosomal protein L18e|nr:50S ribosomal protein L18e [Candidatus Woesearchaeota archaeon]HJN56541.1 50S ribosomal protein L18e [Candidatus Woesearchaeota archaeon]|tara:strand:+ start:850 stop:1287 length:438 start_codon:yes stop_codon:yes gene_type:complete